MGDEHGVVVVKGGGERQLVEQLGVDDGNHVEEELEHPPHREDQLDASRRRLGRASG